MKLASFARVSHLVQKRQQLLDHMEHELQFGFHCVWQEFVDSAMIDALNSVITPAIKAELQRRINVIETELLELGMSIG
ncbi:hypothetical protein [Blastomonas sp.]|uniref:hypothetical protein n=1 Tax=Blastomonas sp. TaxID=1909299 RepID=UPI00391DBFFE